MDESFELPEDIEEKNEKAKLIAEQFERVRKEVAKLIVGQDSIIERLLIALLSDGHVLLEGLPGLGKTMMISTLARVIGCNFKRVQFTPDLLPADIIGTKVYNQKTLSFETKMGPIFTNILLADEINRAPPKTQAALLEGMQERQVTISGDT
ncbi:MAG TPA: AAA family ATPase, partial [Candidatus Altiarchaeales archaeon]|nr:AAA family ATPase [Candidatus Altiarchaeales archaeon]